MDTERTKFCVACGTPFQAHSAMHRYCEEHSRSIQYRSRKGILPGIRERYCRQCGSVFQPASNNEQHCSTECSKKSARESRCRFYDRKPEKYKEYHDRSRQKTGTDGNLRRFYVRFPEAPRSCEACGESRVLDIAHKPEHRRDGAWRSKANTTWPDKVWILCPTCHALVDRKGYEPTSLGLA